MTQVVLIRPGATVYDEQNRVQGILDLPLSDRGRAEVVQLAERLARAGGEEQGQGQGPNAPAAPVSLTALYCGPGESCIRTAEIVGKALGLRPRRIDDLRNLDQGLWQGLQREEIKRRNLKVFRQWLDDPATVCPPHGETIPCALERVAAALRPLFRRHPDESIGLIVAEPIARLIACHLRRAPRVQLEDQVPTGGFERIEVAPDLGRNGHL